MIPNQTDLSMKMREIANRDHLGDDHPMRSRANDFDVAVALGDAKRILGAWARARRTYSEYTGEPLI